jgi:hypothetical protein
MNKLPKDTAISTYFEYKGKVFEKMSLPDGRIFVRIYHTFFHEEEPVQQSFNDGAFPPKPTQVEPPQYLGDGIRFEYADGILRSGINPLHIVGIYRGTISESMIMYDVAKFLEKYYKGTGQSAG